MEGLHLPQITQKLTETSPTLSKGCDHHTEMVQEAALHTQEVFLAGS
jgi:hypothetical protein